MDAIAADTVCHIIEKARAFDAQVEPEIEEDEDASNPVDDEDMAALEGHGENATEEELHEIIEGLNVDARAELVALAWIGRGDFTGEQWRDALGEARDRANDRTAEYLLGLPMLGDYLEEGLAALGYDCADVAEGRA